LARKEADMVKEKASDFLKDGAAKVEKSRVN